MKVSKAVIEALGLSSKDVRFYGDYFIHFFLLENEWQVHRRCNNKWETCRWLRDDGCWDFHIYDSLDGALAYILVYGVIAA